MARPVTPTKKVCAMPDSFPSRLVRTTRSRTEQGGDEHGFSPRNTRPGPGVDAGDLGAGHVDPEDYEALLRGPSLRGGDRESHLHQIELVLIDDVGAGEPAPFARREAGREADAEALALEVRLDDVARVPEAPGVESGERYVVTDPGGFGRREEAALDQLPEQRQERLALGDQGVRGRENGKATGREEVQQRLETRVGEPVQRVIAEEQVERPTVEPRAPGPRLGLLRSAEHEPRPRQGRLRRPRVGSKLVSILGRSEHADQPDREPLVDDRGAQPSRAAAPPALGERRFQVDAQRACRGVKPRDVGAHGAGFPQPRRRVAVDLHQLPSSVAGPRPVESGEEAPGLGSARACHQWSKGWGNSDWTQQLGMTLEMRQDAPHGSAEHEAGMAELVPHGPREAYRGEREVGEAAGPDIGIARQTVAIGDGLPRPSGAAPALRSASCDQSPSSERDAATRDERRRLLGEHATEPERRPPARSLLGQCGRLKAWTEAGKPAAGEIDTPVDMARSPGPRARKPVTPRRHVRLDDVVVGVRGGCGERLLPLV